METIFEITDDILIARIEGDIDHHSASTLRNSIDEALKKFKCRYLVMDFSGVEFMDSSGIGVVLGRYKKLVKTGGIIYISGSSVYIEKLLEMAGVFTLVEKAENLREAESLIKGQQMRMEV